MNPREITQIGGYRVKRFISEGGMAWVFEVIDPRFEGHDVVRALKLLKPEAAVGVEFERFRAEAGLLAGLDNPNLVTIFDFDHDEATDCFYYTMTYVDGGSLSQLLAQHGALTPERAVEIFSDVLSGLGELHRKKIVHRDIKPHNIFMHADGRVRLGDLGIARVEDTTHRTRAGYGIGTVLYMSPEQASGGEQRAPSDIFSVGLTLYEALTAQNVYDAVGGVDSTNDFEVIGYLASRGRAGQELEINFGATMIPDPMVEVIRKALHYNPGDRYQGADDMRTALRVAHRAALREGAPARTQLHQIPVAPAPRRRSYKWIVVPAILAAVGIGGWLALDRWRVESVALEAVETAERLEAKMPELQALAKGLDEPLPAQLRGVLERAAASAADDLADARQFAEIQQWGAARTTAQRAVGVFDAACGRLNAEVLAGRVDRAARKMDQRVEALRSRGVEKHLPKEWTAFTAEVASISQAPPPAGCEGTEAHFERHAAIQGAIAGATALEGRFEAFLPAAITEVIAELETEKALAEAEEVDDDAYRARIARAESAIEQGDSARATGELTSALDAYGRATGEYRDAAQLVPAAKARGEVRDLVELLGGAPLGKAKPLVASADRYYTGGEWKKAREAYEEAANRLTEIIDRGEKAQVVTAKRDQATRSREEALRKGAEELAAASLAQGDRDYDLGATALEAERFEEARSHFASAIGHFEDAALEARETQAKTRAREEEEKLAAERQVEEAILKLETEKAFAEADEVDDDAYRVRIARAESAAEQGEAARATGDLTSALEGYDRATRAYQDAVEVVRAAKARAEVRYLLKLLGEAPLGEAKPMVASADRYYTGEEWEKAREAYEVAATHLNEIASAEKTVQFVREKSDQATRSREKALRRGAEEWAAAALAQGDREHGLGATALEAERYEAAKAHFASAIGHFEDAERTAIEELAKVRKVEEEQRLAAERETKAALEVALARQGRLERDLGFCRGAEAPSAQEECGMARTAFSRGADFVQVKDFAAADGRFDIARSALGRAKEAEKKWPWPPEISARSPAAQNVSVTRGRQITLSVHAKDRNEKDRLTYAWDFDGTPVAGSGQQIQLRPERAGRVTVRVDDGTGRDASTSWQIALVEVKKAAPAVPLAAAPKTSGALGPCADPSDPNRPLADVLHLYEKAFESCQVRELEKVWIMTRTDKLGYSTLCNHYNRNLDAMASAKRFDISGKKASICFQWSVFTERGGTRVKVIGNQFDDLRTAQLTCRADGWYFSQIADGCAN